MKKAFWFHYNKPQSSIVKRPQISVHYNGACHIVDNISCKVAVNGRIRKTQPRWVVAGKANKITIEDNIAYIE